MNKAIIWLITLVLCAASEYSLACSCIPPGKYRPLETDVNDWKPLDTTDSNAVVKYMLQESDYVLTGTFVSQSSYSEYEEHGEYTIIRITEFSVEKVWKGKKVNNIWIKRRVRLNCSYSGFRPGVSYLLYLSGPDPDGFYQASACSRTNRLSESEEDIRILDGMYIQE